MNAITGMGKYLFAVPMAIFGLFHFMAAEDMAAMVPIPGGVIWIYITGLALLAAAISILIGKMDKLAATLLGILLLILALSVHLPVVASSGGEDQIAMGNLLKDLALSGGAFMYARYVARDSTAT